MNKNKMTVDEYRKKHPHCYFCKHSKEMLPKETFPSYHCCAKEKEILFNTAKRCPLYETREYKERK